MIRHSTLLLLSIRDLNHRLILIFRRDHDLRSFAGAGSDKNLPTPLSSTPSLKRTTALRPGLSEGRPK
jgi:hypothetical protein